MKIGLLGGTFDPMHLGHIKLLETAMKRASLDATVVMPAGSPYHKRGQLITPSVYRYELCKRSVRRLEQLMLSDMEMLREGDTYTIDTVEALAALQGRPERLTLIYGSDVLFEILDWKRPEELLAKSTLLVAVRPEDNWQAIKEQASLLQTRHGAQIRLLKDKQMPISSTQLRRAIRLEKRKIYAERCQLVLNYLASEPGREIPEALCEDLDEGAPEPFDWTRWLAPKAAGFIRENELYVKEVLLLALRPETQAALAAIERKLFALIGRKRLIHSWNTLFTALELALRFSVDPDKAALAALTHDAAKELDYETQLELFPEDERAAAAALAPGILHGPAGAQLLARHFGIDDPDIRSAVRYHTTLYENASPLDKIIFLADKIEPARSYKALNGLRKLARKHLNAAVVATLKDLERYLLRENLKPHPLSRAALKRLRSEEEQGRWEQAETRVL